MPPPLVTHAGGCHCGAVRWTVRAPAHVTSVVCDCSLCRVRGNGFLIVPEAAFALTAGADHLTEYRFNTRTARHLFCRACGVTSFYRPRSNPDGVSVLVAAIDPGTLAGITTSHFHGQEWEASAAAGVPALCGAEAEGGGGQGEV